MFEAMIRGIRSEVGAPHLSPSASARRRRVERKSVTKNAVANAGGDASVQQAAGQKGQKARPERPLPVRQAPARTVCR